MHGYFAGPSTYFEFSDDIRKHEFILVTNLRSNVIRKNHRLNMELDLQSLFGLHVHSCTLWLRPRNPPPPPAHPAFGLI